MSKKGGEGGGVISNPKNCISNLRKLTHIYKLSQKKAQCNFQKRGGGGGSKAVWNFSKKNPNWGIRTPLIDQRQSFTQTWQRTPPDFFTPVACRLVRLSVRGASGYQSLVCRAASRMSIVNTDNQTFHGRGVWRHSGGLYLQQHLSTRPVIIWVNRAPRVFSRL